MTALADRAWLHMQHLRVDEESDELLEAFLRGMLSAADRLSLIAHGDETRGPAEVLTNPAKAEIWSLPVAAMFTGGDVPRRRTGETDDAYLTRARVEITRPRGMRRGFTEALIDVATPFVAAGESIRAVERLGGSVWRAGVVVRTGAVDDLNALTEALNDPATVVAGMRIEVFETDSPLMGEWTLPMGDVAVAMGDLTIGDVT